MSIRFTCPLIVLLPDCTNNFSSLATTTTLLQMLRQNVSTLRAERLALKPHQLMMKHILELTIRVDDALLNYKGSEQQHPRQLSTTVNRLTVETFHQVITGLKTFVTTFAKTDRFVFRLASVRRMFLDLEALGVKLDWVMKEAGISKGKVVDPQWGDGEWTWQKQLQADRDAEETELSARAAKNALPFARNMMPHEPMEALTLLKFEIDFFKTGNSTKHVNSMKKVFFSVVRSSNGRVARIPEWYIPPYALNYTREKDAGAEGSVGVSYHGMWVDKKPSDDLKPEKIVRQNAVAHNVVVKRILIHADAIEFFRKDVELWFNLEHDNILKLHGASHCSRPAILVLEEAANGPLVSYLHRQRLKRYDMWNVFLQAAQGLKYLHDNKLVHGNLKSSNILVSSDGHVKLADFGLGMLTLQNEMLQNEVVEERRRKEGETKAQLGQKKEQSVQKVKKFKDMGWRAPNCQKKVQFGRPTFQDDVYSFGLCLLDAFVPDQYSSVGRNMDGGVSVAHVGDLDFDPLAEHLKRAIPTDVWELVSEMCKLDPVERISLEGVISRMKENATKPAFAGVIIKTTPSRRL